MLFLLASAMLILALLLLPVRITLDFHHSQRTLLRLHAAYLPLEKEWRMELLHTPGGRQLIIAGKGEPPHQAAIADMSGGPLDRVVQRLKGDPRARRFLLRHIHVDRLDAQLLLHLQSAANTALITGAVRSVASLLPQKWREHARLSIRPDFLRDKTTLNARCILHIRPGTLFLTAGLLLASAIAAQARKAREALSTWNIPSVN